MEKVKFEVWAIYTEYIILVYGNLIFIKPMLITALCAAFHLSFGMPHQPPRQLPYRV